MINRRRFLGSAVGAGALAATSKLLTAAQRSEVTVAQLDAAAAAPVLKLNSIKSPAKIASIELLRGRGIYFVRARSADGAAGVAVTNSRAAYLYPILNKLVIPYFIGKDARKLESLVDGVYVSRSNYKLSGLALWCCVAWVELSLLDMLGKMARKPVGELLGGVIRREVPIYVASGRRDTTPQQEVALLARMIEANNVYFFEEPCPFDHLEETRRVADALTIPIAGGEQETSGRRFRWMIHNGAVQIVQPDLHYNGGFIRAARVGRMAAAAGLPITPHMSGAGVGYVDVLQFASCTPNIGEFHEYKGGVSRSGKWYDPPLRLKGGAITVPAGLGLGLAADADIFRNPGKVGST